MANDRWRNPVVLVDGVYQRFTVGFENGGGTMFYRIDVHNSAPVDQDELILSDIPPHRVLMDRFHAVVERLINS